MRHATTSGYAMAALLVGLSVMSIMLGAALPVWQTAIKREREASSYFAASSTLRSFHCFNDDSPERFHPVSMSP
jgi:type II secretory pathway pseudopilin PulG